MQALPRFSHRPRRDRSNGQAQLFEGAQSDFRSVIISKAKQNIEFNPNSLIARALAMAEANACEQALALLHGNRQNFTSLPPRYDAVTGRLSLRSNLIDDAIDYLTRARDAYQDKLPGAVQRDLADALLRAGRVEAAGRELCLLQQAGGKLLGRAQVAAAMAYEQRRGDALDSGSPTPWHIMAQARVRDEAGDRIAAVEFLLQHRGRWASVPDPYDTTICELATNCGDGEAAIALLSRLRDESRTEVSAHVRRTLGALLCDAGRSDEGARELSLAMAAGVTVARPDLCIAVACYRSRTGEGDPVETSLPKPYTLIDHEKKLVYLSIPKNASSLLRLNFVMNTSHRAAYLAGQPGIEGFCARLTAGPFAREQIMSPNYFRFVVLRDPLLRVLSAYLDKFVRKRNARYRDIRVRQMTDTIRAAQALAGISYDPARSISFEEFVRFLSTAADTDLNMHWMPQWRSVGTDLAVFNHVGKVERLDETLGLLSRRFGFVIEAPTVRHVPEINRHRAKFSETADLKAPYRALPHELDEFRNGLPMPELFFTPAMREMLRERYATDVGLYEQA
jgi:hypothetical protein